MSSRNEPIYLELMVSCGLQTLANFHQIPTESCWHVIDVFIYAVDINEACMELQINMHDVKIVQSLDKKTRSGMISHLLVVHSRITSTIYIIGLFTIKARFNM